MSQIRSFQSEVRDLLRNRILDTARDLVIDGGWSSVNMSKVARMVGISRAGLYNEMGTRQDLAAALVAREADRFLTGVADAIASHPDDLVAGLAAAAASTLRTGEENRLLLSVVQGVSGTPESELLSLVAVDSETVLGRAMETVSEQVRLISPAMPDDDLALVTEVMVRLTVSHLLQPRGDQQAAVDQIRATMRGLTATLD
ncbi:putative transcriptional regulator, TetR family protein [Gordonia spumicola]|uniref:Putative transcriptional regulator, TetR family protein n=1 Tax=Gordonia spumicola TaxID=589161 RepID=A0A7I9V8G2_9ACTN|nr:TetR family transcriptional regulator [Gordonia spumicola]GEE01678.1 putative transcriptional regulator, TetR family protein [Gordonia spumicola]